MPAAKFSKDFDYRDKKNRGPMTSYKAGEYDNIPQAHFDAAQAAGALDGAKAPAKADEGGEAGGTGTAKPGK